MTTAQRKDAGIPTVVDHFGNQTIREKLMPCQ
jgi:hypothetical protein